MTELQSARMGIVTDAMKIVSEEENVDVATVCSSIASGESVIPFNKNHRHLDPVGVGRIFKTKINANLGRSVTHSDKGDELDIDLNTGVVVNKTKNKTYQCSPFPKEIQNLINQGGLINYTKEKLGV